MILFKRSKDIQAYLGKPNQVKRSVGFVPTMGALHNGHAALIRLAKKENETTVVSIFVNPLQFNDLSDFEKYPVTVEKDICLLEKLGVDVLFLPAVSEIYPDKDVAKKIYNLGNLDTILEGAFRPGHFQGVANVMDVLLHVVQANNLYLGCKDFQQIKVIQRLVELEDIKTQIMRVPTVREQDGLAMSSRNARLNDEGRKTASLIYKELKYIAHHSNEQSFDTLSKLAMEKLETAGFRIDYLILANQVNLEVLNDFDKSVPMIILTAVYLQGVRLIDNLEI